MSKELPKLDFGRTKGFPFSLVFAFLPKETELYTGSMDRIDEHLRQYPTHHAACCFSRKSFINPELLTPEMRKAYESLELLEPTHFDNYAIFGKYSWGAQRKTHTPDGMYWVNILHLNQFSVDNECKGAGYEYRKYKYGFLEERLTERFKYFFVWESRLFRKDNPEVYIDPNINNSKLLFSCRHMPHHYIKEFAQLDKKGTIGKSEKPEKKNRFMALEI